MHNNKTNNMNYIISFKANISSLYILNKGYVTLNEDQAKLFNSINNASEFLKVTSDKYDTIIEEEWEIIECDREFNFTKIILDTNMFFSHQLADIKGIKYIINHPITRISEIIEDLTKSNFILRDDIENIILNSKVIRDSDITYEYNIKHINMIPLNYISDLVKECIITTK